MVVPIHTMVVLVSLVKFSGQVHVRPKTRSIPYPATKELERFYRQLVGVHNFEKVGQVFVGLQISHIQHKKVTMGKDEPTQHSNHKCPFSESYHCTGLESVTYALQPWALDYTAHQLCGDQFLDQCVLVQLGGEKNGNGAQSSTCQCSIHALHVLHIKPFFQ